MIPCKKQSGLHSQDGHLVRVCCQAWGSSWILEVHTVEGETHFHKTVLWLPHLWHSFKGNKCQKKWGLKLITYNLLIRNIMCGLWRVHEGQETTFWQGSHLPSCKFWGLNWNCYAVLIRQVPSPAEPNLLSGVESNIEPWEYQACTLSLSCASSSRMP